QIYNYGSINIDHIYRVPHLVQPGETLASHDYQQVLGGKGANQSIALAKAGASVRHIGRYHANDDALLENMRSAGVDTGLLQTTDTPSGHAIIQVDDNAENSIVLYAGANHSFKANELAGLLESAQPGDWLLLQNECSCTAEMIDAAVAAGLKVAFNPAPMTEAITQLPLEKLSVLFINQIEALQLLQADIINPPSAEEMATQLQQMLPNTEVVITLGAKGACHVYQGKTQYAKAWKVEAVDTTGAGDTFIGYYLQAITEGKAVDVALKQGCAASALCVQQMGASSSIPTASAVNQFLAGVNA
ncbi:MAG: ribokinase, partial [Thiolinea sp.]